MFLDLDDVVFDTKRFLADLRERFTATHVPADIFDACYHSRENGIYAVETHIDCMARRTQCSRATLENIMETYIKEAPLYVFPDMQGLMKEYGEHITILSFGSKDFQKRKIAASGVGKYVSRVIVTEEPKEMTLQGLYPLPRHFFFVEDRAAHIDAVKKAFPEAIAIFMHRKEGRYDDLPPASADHIVKNGEELAALISF